MLSHIIPSWSSITQKDFKPESCELPKSDCTDMDAVPYLDLQTQYDALRSEMLTALGEICKSSKFAQGPATADFEAKFAEYCGVDHCVSLNSGTAHCIWL